MLRRQTNVRRSQYRGTMTANTPPAAKPPQPGSVEHWTAWLDRYGDDYATDDERRAAYQDFKTNLATMQAAFHLD